MPDLEHRIETSEEALSERAALQGLKTTRLAEVAAAHRAIRRIVTKAMPALRRAAPPNLADDWRRKKSTPDTPTWRMRLWRP